MRANNARIRAVDRCRANPREIDDLLWHRGLLRRHAAIRAEWRAFAVDGGRLSPVDEPGRHAGVLVVNGRTTPGATDSFPRTMDALARVPGLRRATWVELEPGATSAPRVDPNAGTLRYALTVVGNADCGLRVAGTEVAGRERTGVLFDATAEHAAWNRGARSWVVLGCDVLRPLPWASRGLNRAVQRLLALGERVDQLPRPMPAFCSTSADTPSSRHDA